MYRAHLTAAFVVFLALLPHSWGRTAGENWPGFAQAGFKSDVDAAIDWGNGKMYFFRGANYVRYDIDADSVDAGYPLPIAGHWPGMDKGEFDQGIDAAINWGNGKAYFFRGANYVRYDIDADSVDAGYPLPIAGHWPGMDKGGFDQGIDAAINWGNGKVYFFRGRHYVRYDIAADSVDAGYPLPIAGNWSGMDKGGFDQGVRAAINWGNGKAYFFRGRHYVRYDIDADSVDAGYPALICP